MYVYIQVAVYFGGADDDDLYRIGESRWDVDEDVGGGGGGRSG